MLTDLVGWLAQPIDATRPHLGGDFGKWHGRLMGLAWAVCLPCGVLIARFFKVTRTQDWPRELDNKFWWRAHLRLQYTGAALTLVGLALIYVQMAKISFDHPHHLLGWLTIFLLLVQVLGGLLRGTTGGPQNPAADGSWRGDHYDMTPRRLLFERVHKSCGYLALFSGAVAVFLGLWVANAPIWMWITLVGWWLTLGLAFGVFQAQNRVFDTYQAIWGPSEEHPGNARKAVGAVLPAQDSADQA